MIALRIKTYGYEMVFCHASTCDATDFSHRSFYGMDVYDSFEQTTLNTFHSADACSLHFQYIISAIPTFPILRESDK